MSSSRGLPTALKILIPLGIGAAFAGVISLEAGNDGPPGQTPDFAQVPLTPTVTPIVEIPLNVAPPPPPSVPPSDARPGMIVPPTVPPGLIQTPTPRPSVTSPTVAPAAIAEAMVLAQEATAAARAVSPDVYLFTVTYRGSQSAYGFVSADGQKQVAVQGPNVSLTAPRWDARSADLLPKPVMTPPPPLDLTAVRRSPAQALTEFAAKVRIPASELRIQLHVDPQSRQAFWTAAHSAPSSPAGGERDTGFLCLLTEPDGKWVDPC